MIRFRTGIAEGKRIPSQGRGFFFRVERGPERRGKTNLPRKAVGFALISGGAALLPKLHDIA